MMVTHHTAGMSRRTLLTGALATSAIAGAGSLAGCAGSKDSPAGGSSPVRVDKSIFPTYVENPNLPKADLAGSTVVPNYYFSYPTERPQSVNHPMGSGGKMRSFILTYSAPPKPLSENKYWQFINEKLGVDFQPELVSADSYQSKFATLTASGDLPDTIQVVTSMSPPRLDALVHNAFSDLTDLLKGDNIKKWPNLAALPTDTWRVAMLNGKIWGIPVMPQPITSGLWMREDLAQKKGIKEIPKTKDDFVSWCEEMTDAKGGKYALGGFAGGSPVWIPNTGWGMFKVPNRFRLQDDGKLMKAQETEEYLEAIEFTKQLWDKKYFHPDSPTMPMDKNRDAFREGSIAAKEGGFGSFWEQSLAPDHMMTFRTPWAADGGQGVHWAGTAFSVTVIKKGHKNIEQVLNIIDWLNAPFGTKEHFENRFGPEGVTHTMKDGQPVDIPGTNETLRTLNTVFVGAGTQEMFTADPVMKPHYERWYKGQKELEPMVVQDPTVGYYAEANSRAGTLDMAIDDAQGDYIMGRKSLDQFKQVIKDWRKNGGDTICKQYEAAIEANK